MEYTIKQLSDIAGVSTRTLRYYDEINLLTPAYINDSGYRMYADKEVDVLHQILLLKELGLSLQTIEKMIESPSFHQLDTLKEHIEKLKQKRVDLDLLIDNVTKTILQEEGRYTMTDLEKFQGIKKEIVDKNEETYGKETREQYGDKAIEEANRKMLNLTKEEYDRMQQLEEEIRTSLENAVKSQESPTGEEGRRIANLHKEWLLFSWSQYSKEAHVGLAQMYVGDERFQGYYDREISGCAEFLKAAIENL